MAQAKDSTPLLELKKINTFYGPVQALRDVSLYVDKGEIVTIIGANGAGKSTLLMTVFSNPPARGGDILFHGNSIKQLKTSEIAQLGISLVPEGRRIFPGLTVEENLFIGAVRMQPDQLQKSADNVYSIFPLLAERRSQRGGTLSGGEQQMLAIGRGLMSKPDFLLLDEPSLGLAPLVVQQIFATLKDIAAEGITILLVEQNANLALRLAQRGYVLVNGSVVLSGKSQELLKNKEVQAAYLGGGI